MNKTIKSLLKSLRNKDNVVTFDNEIESLLSALYQKDFSTKIKKIVTMERAQIFIDEFTKMKWKVDLIKDFLKNLHSGVSNLKVVEITLAFEPSAEFLNTLYSWTKTNFGTDAILDIVVDKNIIAGVKITYGGYIKDFSFKNILTKSMSNRKKGILQCLA